MGGTAVTRYAEGALGAVGATVALQAFTDNITVADSTVGPTEAEIETYLGTNSVFQNGSTNDGIYIAADNGIDTFIFLITEGADGTDKQFDAADDAGVAIMRIIGLNDVSSLDGANFTNFTNA